MMRRYLTKDPDLAPDSYSQFADDFDEHTGLPVLRVVYSTSTGVFVWCSHCKKQHRHGRGALGHRAAHCAPDSGSPFLSTGYIIRRGRPNFPTTKRVK
jgi:hypothetical protein